MNKDFENYIENSDIKYRESFKKIVEIIDKNLPKGFEKGMQYGFPSYFVPLTVYPKGYRGNSSEPIPFMAVGIQKNYIYLFTIMEYMLMKSFLGGLKMNIVNV